MSPHTLNFSGREAVDEEKSFRAKEIARWFEVRFFLAAVEPTSSVALLTGVA